MNRAEITEQITAARPATVLKEHPHRDRVVITVDGKFLAYEWDSALER